jgi:hypothetical protein
MNFRIGEHPTEGTPVVLIFDDTDRYIAAIVPSSRGTDITVISEFIAKENGITVGITVDEHRPSLEALVAVSAEMGVPLDDVLREQKASGLPWPTGVNITFDLTITERARS